MSHPYDISYLNNAMRLVGSIFDFAVNEEGREIDYFIDHYFLPKIAEDIQTGNPFIVAGLSYNEAYARIVGYDTSYPLSIEKSPEYWAGWVLTFTSWHHDRTFAELLSVLPASSLARMYHPLHEADETKTADLFEEKILAKDLEISDRIELDLLKALGLHKSNENDYSVLFLLTRANEMRKGLSQGYVKDTDEFPWQELSMIVKSSLEDRMDSQKLRQLIGKILPGLKSLENLRKKYITKIIKAKYGSFHPSLLKEYEEKEKQRKIILELNKI